VAEINSYAANVGYTEWAAVAEGYTEWAAVAEA